MEPLQGQYVKCNDGLEHKYYYCKCMGSTCARSISSPIMGANSCLLFCSAINDVTLLRLVLVDNLDLAKDVLSHSTCLTTLILSEYFQGFQMSDGSRSNVPQMF